MNCSLPGSSVHEIFQERILEWLAMFSNRESFCYPRVKGNKCWMDRFNSRNEKKKLIRPHSVRVRGGRAWDVLLTQFWALGYFHEENCVLPRKRVRAESVRLANTKDQRPVVSAWRDGWETPRTRGPRGRPGETGGCTTQGVPFSCTCGRLHILKSCQQKLKGDELFIL